MSNSAHRSGFNTKLAMPAPASGPQWHHIAAMQRLPQLREMQTQLQERLRMLKAAVVTDIKQK